MSLSARRDARQVAFDRREETGLRRLRIGDLLERAHDRDCRNDWHDNQHANEKPSHCFLRKMVVAV